MPGETLAFLTPRERLTASISRRVPARAIPNMPFYKTHAPVVVVRETEHLFEVFFLEDLARKRELLPKEDVSFTSAELHTKLD